MPNLLSLFIKYKRALKGISRIYNDTKQKDKHFLLKPIYMSGISRMHARYLGFNASCNIWNSCKHSHIRNKGKVNF
jgi:hypothetical protein